MTQMPNPKNLYNSMDARKEKWGPLHQPADAMGLCPGGGDAKDALASKQEATMKRQPTEEVNVANHYPQQFDQELLDFAELADLCGSDPISTSAPIQHQEQQHPSLAESIPLEGKKNDVPRQEVISQKEDATAIPKAAPVATLAGVVQPAAPVATLNGKQIIFVVLGLACVLLAAIAPSPSAIAKWLEQPSTIPTFWFVELVRPVFLELMSLVILGLILANGVERWQGAGIIKRLCGSSKAFSSTSAASLSTARKAQGTAADQPRQVNDPSRKPRGSGNAAEKPPPASNLALMKARHSIHNAVKAEDMALAVRILDDLEKNGPFPDQISYNLMIRGCILKNDLPGAEGFFLRMEGKGLKPTLCSYNMLLDAFAKAQRLDWCDAWLKNMRRDGVQPDTITFGTIMTAHARRGEKVLAEKLLKQMLSEGVEPDAMCYNALVHACAVSCDATGAERFSADMQKRGLPLTVTTYTAMIDAWAKCGDVSKAESWLERMVRAGVEPNVISYGALLDACARKSDPVRAEHWYMQMLNYGISANSHTFSALVTACSRSKDPAGAERWLNRAEECGVLDSVIYSGVIDAYSKLGDGPAAEAVFKRMRVAGVVPHVVAYASLARPFARKGDYQKVEGIITDMEAAGVPWNEYVLFSLLLAYSLGKPKNLTRQRAETAFRKAMCDGLPPNVHVCGALARNLGRQRTNELMKEYSKEPPPADNADGGLEENEGQANGSRFQ